MKDGYAYVTATVEECVAKRMEVLSDRYGIPVDHIAGEIVTAFYEGIKPDFEALKRRICQDG